MNERGGTNNTFAYINKLVAFASNGPPGQIFISASAEGYNDANWYFDDSKINVTNTGPPISGLGYLAQEGVWSVNSLATVFYSYNSIITNCTNVAGYYSPGVHNNEFTGGYPTNRQLVALLK